MTRGEVQPLMMPILDRLERGERTRIVAFGSSNTERRIAGPHWFDWLDLALKEGYGRVHHCINAGLGGDTTRGLLSRFDEDVALYRPHAVIITIGGNDSKPDSDIDEAAFRVNLAEVVARCRNVKAVPILQTYYSADVEGLGPCHGPRFLTFMGAVRRVADDTKTALIDHHARWEPLRKQKPDLYQRLMIDPLHVNALGNSLMGLDLIRAFGARLSETDQIACAAGIWYQQLLDRLESAH